MAHFIMIWCPSKLIFIAVSFSSTFKIMHVSNHKLLENILMLKANISHRIQRQCINFLFWLNYKANCWHYLVKRSTFDICFCWRMVLMAVSSCCTLRTEAWRLFTACTILIPRTKTNKANISVISWGKGPKCCAVWYPSKMLRHKPCNH